MADQRISQAIARIEAAAARIEAAASPANSAPDAAEVATQIDSELANRHEALRREAWTALAEIDTLIETLEA